MQAQQYENGARPQPSNTKQNSAARIAVVITLFIIVGVAGFVGGVHYQKGRPTTSVSNANGSQQFGPGGTGRANQNGAFGSVTAISASSISVKDQRSGSTKTYSITSNTTITNNGSAATYSDIAVGDDVFVAASSSTATEAARIALNPSMGGGFGQQDSSSSSSSMSN